MTPETYMRRYHGDEEEGEFAACPLDAEELFPSARDAGSCACREEEQEEDCGRSRPQPPTCCCKTAMREALELLCGERLGSLVDFDSFFFLTNSLAIGSALSVPGEDIDNIAAPNAELRRFSPCSCDLLDVSGTAYFAIPDTENVALEDVDQLSLCSLKAVAFQIEEAECERECGDSNYDRAIRAIRRAIRAEGGNAGACSPRVTPQDCGTCCCTAGLLNELSARNLSRQATLTVGPLVLQNVTVLGAIGSALVLASEELERIYLVCAEAVEALG